MNTLSNLHTHTIYCDGALTPEQMVKAAAARGCKSLGFSGHSYFPSDPKYSMSPENTQLYRREILRLKREYFGEIEIYLGLEQDYYSDAPTDEYDYIIGSTHYLKRPGHFICVDAGAGRLQNAVREYFDGDIYSLIEEYFMLTADIVNKTNADIIGHFDLLAKYNENGALFDESHPRYMAAAIYAMEKILKTHKLFEVNTGAMYRVGKREPYPSIFLLKELQKRGGEVILSSDSHDAESLCYKFRETANLLKECGFKYIKRLSETGFISEKL